MWLTEKTAPGDTSPSTCSFLFWIIKNQLSNLLNINNLCKHFGLCYPFHWLEKVKAASKNCFTMANKYAYVRANNPIVWFCWASFKVTQLYFGRVFSCQMTCHMWCFGSQFTIIIRPLCSITVFEGKWSTWINISLTSTW